MKRFLALWLVTLALPALAHEVNNGPNGGRIADAGDYHVELVAKGAAIEVFLTDAADKPVAPVGFKGVAILLVDGKSQRIALEPADNKLSGTVASALPVAPKGAVQITPPNGKTAQARFN